MGHGVTPLGNSTGLPNLPFLLLSALRPAVAEWLAAELVPMREIEGSSANPDSEPGGYDPPSESDGSAALLPFSSAEDSAL